MCGRMILSWLNSKINILKKSKVKMKQTIEIEVPDGYKAVYNKDTQKIEIVKVGLPKSWDEFCENNPIKNWECFITERSKIEDFYTEDSAQ